MVAVGAAKQLIVVCGPTAVGKTALAIQLAKQYHTEIISADSRQFYREMSIGTAKPSAEELAAAPHHFINSHSITEEFNAGAFEKAALLLLEQLFTQYDTVIAVGGSGLYISALCAGLDELPEKDEAVRKQLQTVFEAQGITALQAQLQELDPVYYQQVDTHNPQRLLRALEVCLVTGKPYSSFRKQSATARPFTITKIGLDLPRPQLYAQINTRVEQMMQAGLLKEAEQLYANKHLNALQTVGYTELFDYFDQKHSLPRAIELIQQNTRRFAKRQLTWFGRDEEIKWFSPADTTGIVQHITGK